MSKLILSLTLPGVMGLVVAFGNINLPTVTTVQTHALTLTTSADPTPYDHIGQTVTFTYIIKNSGIEILGPDQFIVGDDHIGALNCGSANTRLPPNATVTCTATYAITPADLNAISVTHIATAVGRGAGLSQPVSTTINKSIPALPKLVAGNTILHQVVTGEWLWQIARCYGADPQSVIQANPQLSNPDQIWPNISVNVPNIGSVGNTVYGPPCVVTYTVQSGDTWNSIAPQYNADSSILQKANPGPLSVGSVLKVPCNSASGAQTNACAPFPVSGKIQVGDQSTMGGKAGLPLSINAKFEASSPQASVTEMRVKQSSFDRCLTPEEMNDAPWETFVTGKTYTYNPPLNWSTFILNVQYRNAQGNLSSVYCGKVTIEGTP